MQFFSVKLALKIVTWFLGLLPNLLVRPTMKGRNLTFNPTKQWRR